MVEKIPTSDKYFDVFIYHAKTANTNLPGCRVHVGYQTIKKTGSGLKYEDNAW